MDARNGNPDVDNLEFARVDLARLRRQGVPEVVYGAGKTAEQIVAILSSLRDHGQFPVLSTRMDNEKAKAVAAALGDDFTYFPVARLGRLGSARAPDGLGKIAVAAAGTSDLPVAEEAALTAETLGNEVTRLYDVGVAGLHRLLACADELRAASVVVAVAGMEGALASVVGGLVGCPVVAVPTSVGYGASFGGVAALLSMLNSCATGVSVVNIDNGFGAGFLAHRINHMGLDR
ncbi:MAG: nickel pincer cofactor biosynthesis protein LarB [Kiritimatiellae bacterium]|nr:nickel pincer cofactor biosynthesis protein LarB [Kiritimatiellia bacterium]